MRIEYSSISDKGLHREVNQDAIFAKVNGHMAMLAVADGMGGHSYGEKASEIIVTELEKCWVSFLDLENCQFNKLVDEIILYLEHANQMIYEGFNRESICGTTIVLLFIYGNSYCTISAGDSRIYTKEGFILKQITSDDVWENQLDVIHNYKKKEILNHSSYGKLVSAVGIKPSVSLNVRTDLWENKVRFLLCSDGLYKMCTEKEIRKILGSYKGNKNGDIIINKALKMVYDKGARDNVSMILVVCEEQ